MKSRNFNRFVLTPCFVVASWLMATTSWAENYTLLVNAENAYAAPVEEAKQEIKLLFLKQKTFWADGTPAKPLARPQDSEENKVFLSNVLQMSPSEIAQYWLSMKQKTGQTPPREMDSPRILLKMIGVSREAFALFKSSDVTPAPPGTRVLFVIEQ